MLPVSYAAQVQYFLQVLSELHSRVQMWQNSRLLLPARLQP